MSIRYQNGILCSESVSATESVLSTMNQCSLPKVCYAANLLFAAETKLSAANQRSLPKVCVLQRICDSLPKSSC